MNYLFHSIADGATHIYIYIYISSSSSSSSVLRHFFRASTGLTFLPEIAHLHASRSLHKFLFSPNFFKSSLTHSFHVLLGLPTPLLFPISKNRHADTQSSALFRSTWPNHLNLPHLTTSLTNFIPRRSLNFSLDFLSE